MASTYENDLRLEEMATGENSGSWGTKTNTNLELVADAFSYGTETIADADTAITIADGAADAARSLALKINSSEDLTTTRVVTLGPNTTSKVWIIENNTSGGQTLTISAGSGSNITLANGTTKIIATDGIGAGSNVVELTQDIAIADMSVDGILSLADGTNSAPSLTNTGDTNTGLYFPAADEVGITVGGTQVLKADSTGIDVTGNTESDTITIGTSSVAGSEKLRVNGTVLTLGGSEATPAIGIGDVNTGVYAPTAGELGWTVNGIQRLFLDSTGIDVTGEITADGLTVDGDATLQTSDGTILTLGSTDSSVVSGDVYGSIHFDTADTSNTGTAARIEVTASGSSAHGVMDFYTTLEGTQYNRMKINFDGDITFYDTSGNASFVYDESAGSTFNEQGADRDFRVESDTVTHALFLDGTNGRLGLGTGAPAQKVDIAGGGLQISGNIISPASGVTAMQVDYASGGARYWSRGADTGVRGTHKFYTLTNTGGSQITPLIIDNTGGVIINEDSANADFRVESDTQTHAFFVDASTDNVGIHDSAPTSTLTVQGNKSFSWNADGTDNVATTMIGLRTTTDNQNSFAVAGTTHNTYYPSSWVVDSSHDDSTNTTFFDLTAYGVKFGGWTGVMRLNTSQGASVHEALRLRDSEAVFNEGSNNTDFRVESDSTAYMLFVDAGKNAVSINGSTVATDGSNNYPLSVRANTAADAIAVVGRTTDDIGELGFYESDGTTQLGNIQGRSSDGGMRFRSLPTSATMHFDLTDSSGVLQNRMLFQEAELRINDPGDDYDFRVESENNTHMLYLNAEKDTVRLGNGGGNSAPLSFHKSKSSRYFGKYIDSTAAAAAKVADLMVIDSWQSGNSRLFGTVTFWSVNPVGDYANYGRASFFAKNTVDGTGNTVTTFTELEEKGTMSLPTLTWTGTGLRTLTFNMPAVAYQKWIVDITFVSADGANTTLYDDAAVGVDP